MTRSSRPNLIFILADDLGYADLGCTGARAAVPVTPNLDRLAARGALFTHGYSNSPVCSPTRFALITGRWQYRLRGAADEPLTGKARGDKVIGLSPQHPTLPSLLREAGYATALFGKWHLGYPPHFGPLKSGYEHFFGTLSGGIDYFSHVDSSGTRDLWNGEEPCSDSGYLTDMISERVVRYIESHDTKRPFFASVHYTAPHWPWETRSDAAESQRIGKAIRHTDGGSLETYQQMVREMDQGIGRIADALQRAGLDKDTLIVFTSDNGGERYSDNWPFVGQKMDLLEGGIRVPLIACWPQRITAGSISTLPVMTMDWTATLLAAAGVAAHPDYPLDGESLLPLFDDRHWQPSRTDLFWRTAHRQQRALRRGAMKYLRIEGHDYLFNLQHDPHERANLAKRQPGLLDELTLAWEAWNATLPPVPEDAQVTLAFSEAELPRPTH